MKYVYPAVITYDKEDQYYLVQFPDVEGAVTEGDTLFDALYMAEDVLNLMLDDYEINSKQIPEASNIQDLKIDNKNQFVTLIKADTDEYREKMLDDTSGQAG